MARRVSAAPPPALVLDGKSSPKLRGGRKGDISDTQLATFFATLAETCNVVRSAKAAGISKDWAYRKRKRDAGFRHAWAEAVHEGYARLELVLLERAIKGTPKLVRTATGSDRVMREYSNMLGIALLRRHADLAEIRERILERLERLRIRDSGEAIETKSARWRLEVIEAALASTKNPSTASRSPSPRTSGEDA